MSASRTYPRLSVSGNKPKIPISFVVVRFSNEYLHNFLKSECGNSPLNEVVVVENTSNLFFDNLSSAISYGITQTKNELIAVVHEDVRLIDGWQRRFEQSLAELERHDKNWGLLGSVGWAKNNSIIGHWSDPFQYTNTFAESGNQFGEVDRLDEQILVVNQRRLPQFDNELPGIHHIGCDLSIGLREKGLKTYAIDAPTIHKFRDRYGRPVPSSEKSEKIQDRNSLTYLADKSCCDNYIARKRPQLASIYNADGEFDVPFNHERKLSQLDRPVILLSRGGSGSRLLSQMAVDLGIFIGNELNHSGDTLEMVIPVYRAITEKFLCKANWQKSQPVKRIRAAAARMIRNLPAGAPWGFKLPESLLVLPEIQAAFPDANYVHLVRDPLATCLRRTHMTARLDNHIGRISLAQAYDYQELPRRKILNDNPAMHMVHTTIHQLDSVKKFLSEFGHAHAFTIRFEDVITRPEEELVSLGDWLGLQPETIRINSQIDADRARRPMAKFPEAIVSIVEKALAQTRHCWGYVNL